MAFRRVDPVALSTKQMLCLFYGSKLSAEEALALDSSEVTLDMLIDKCVKASNIHAAGIGPTKLKHMGVASADQLRALGFDTLYLADPKFASEANASFGSEEVKRFYLQSASDAVALAGTDAMQLINVSTLELLSACAGASTEAYAVLQQLPAGVSLSGVPASVILDTGLRKKSLASLGYSLTNLVQQTGPSSAELSKLGFSFGLQ